MKKFVLPMSFGALCGIGLTTYVMNNKKMKKKANKLLNNCIEEGEYLLNKMK